MNRTHRFPKRLHLRWLPTTIYIAFLFLPLLWVIYISFHFARGGILLHIGPSTVMNYVHVFQNPVLRTAIINSVAYIILNILMTIPVALFAAYGFSRYSFVGDKHLFFGFLVLRMTPPVVMVLPVFFMYLTLDLLDTPLAIALAHCTFNVPISIWVLESFMSAIPKELDETASIDGHSFFGSLRGCSFLSCAGNRCGVFLLFYVLMGGSGLCPHLDGDPG